MEQTMSNELLYITELITQQNELLAQLHASFLTLVGISAAVFVLFVLYKAIKIFY